MWNDRWRERRERKRVKKSEKSFQNRNDNDCYTDLVGLQWYLRLHLSSFPASRLSFNENPRKNRSNHARETFCETVISRWSSCHSAVYFLFLRLQAEKSTRNIQPKKHTEVIDWFQILLIQSFQHFNWWFHIARFFINSCSSSIFHER